MKKAGFLALIVLVGIILVSLAFLRSRPNEPVYLGRPLSRWLEDLTGKAMEKHEPAKNALRHLGSNAVRRLVEMRQSMDPLLKQKLIELINKQSLLKVRVTTAFDRRHQAIAGCEVLGPVAVPKLTELLNQGDSAPAAADLLRFVAGQAPEAVISLANVLTNNDARVRISAAHALRALAIDANTRRNVGAPSPDARAAVPALANAAGDPIEEVRSAVIAALMQIDPEAAARAELGTKGKANSESAK